MRLVLDTNILISGLISPRGKPAALLDAVRHGRATLITSARQLDEFRDVVARPKLRRFLKPGAAEGLLRLIDAAAVVVADPLPTVTASPDPDDNAILATAVAGRAAWVVTGDKAHLLSLGDYAGVEIITAAEAMRRLDNGGASDRTTPPAQ